MRRRLILIVALIVLAAVTMQAQKHEAQSYIRCVLARKTFNQLMGDARMTCEVLIGRDVNFWRDRSRAKSLLPALLRIR